MIPQKSPSSAAYWPVPLVRALPALIAAVAITFSADHSAKLGLIVFGSFALTSGLLVGASSWRLMNGGTARSMSIVQSAISVAAGVLALALSSGGLGLFIYVVSVWAALTGFLELYNGFRVRPATLASRDWLLTGVFTAVLAIVFLLVPPDAVLVVGLFGAYAVVLGVYLVIAALSLKWDTREADANRDKADELNEPKQQPRRPATRSANKETENAP